MKILILTSCTGEKVVDHPDQLTLEDFQKGSVHLGRRELGLQSLLRSAGEIYTGEQHLRLMRGVAAYRAGEMGQQGGEIELHVLSAGYGIIPESRKVAPYETTFATMKSKELREWADALGVPDDFRRTVAGDYDLGLILLGDNYLQACNLDAAVKFGGPTLLLCGTGMAKKLPTLKNVRVVPVSNPEAKRFSCGLVGLKGDLAARLLHGLQAEPDKVAKLLDPKFDLMAWLEKLTDQQNNCSCSSEVDRITLTQKAVKHLTAK